MMKQTIKVYFNALVRIVCFCADEKHLDSLGVSLIVYPSGGYELVVVSKFLDAFRSTKPPLSRGSSGSWVLGISAAYTVVLMARNVGQPIPKDNPNPYPALDWRPPPRGVTAT